MGTNERPERVTEEQREKIRQTWQIWQESTWERKNFLLSRLAVTMGLDRQQVEDVWEQMV